MNLTKNALIVNLYAPPGSGKTTTRAGIFYELKRLGYEVEESTEYVKGLVYDENYSVIKDQLYLFAKQNRRLESLRDKVDIIVTDAPLLLGLNYITTNYYPENFARLVREVYNSYNNIEFYIERDTPYKQNGRIHTEKESVSLSHEIKDHLFSHSKNPSHIYHTKTSTPIQSYIDIICKHHAATM